MEMPSWSHRAMETYVIAGCHLTQNAEVTEQIKLVVGGYWGNWTDVSSGIPH